MAKQRDRDAHEDGARWAPRKVQKALRITERDEELLASTRASVPEASSESDLAYILWKRGLILTLAKALSAGAPPPMALEEEQLATLIAQELLNVMPLLHRTGRLSLLNLALATSSADAPSELLEQEHVDDDIDLESIAELADLGGADFI